MISIYIVSGWSPNFGLPEPYASIKAMHDKGLVSSMPPNPFSIMLPSLYGKATEYLSSVYNLRPSRILHSKIGNSALRKCKIMLKNQNSAPKNQNPVLIEWKFNLHWNTALYRPPRILHTERAKFYAGKWNPALKTLSALRKYNGALNSPPRILRSEIGILRSKNGIFSCGTCQENS